MKEKKNPEISVIIPVYQSVLYLETLFESLKNQTFRNFEVIVVDDGSDDGSEILCDRWSSEDSRFITIHKPNGGVSSARNTGIENAVSEYICFIDSDDWIDENYLQTFMEYSGEYDLMVSGFCRENDSETVKYLPDEDQLFFDKRFAGKIEKLCNMHLLFGPCMKLYKREIIMKHNIRFQKGISYGEDLLYNLDYFQYTEKIKVLPFASYHYRETIGSLSLKFRKNAFENEYLQWKNIKNLFFKKEMLKEMHVYLNERLFWCACDNISNYSDLKKELNVYERFRHLKKILGCKDLRLKDNDIHSYPVAGWLKKSIIKPYPVFLWVMMEIKNI